MAQRVEVLKAELARAAACVLLLGLTSCGGGGSPPPAVGDCTFADGRPKPAGTVCRPSAGPCDVAEACDGTSVNCPADTFQPPSVVCRPSAGVCDQAESCTGSSAACPADTFQPPSVVCRPSAGVCDQAESCTGSSAACPADLYAPATSVCRAPAGVCDVGEYCTGGSVDCPADGFQPPSLVCRPAAGPCDAAETCTGSSAACPADALLPASTVCRPSAGPCDVAETCTGASVACPADAFLPTSAVCRPAAGPCDLAETCNGASAACPTDQLADPSTLCRAAGGPCDLPEYCTGASVSCPADQLAPLTTVCRSAAGACDATEYCTGASVGCPADSFLPVSTVCRPSAGACDVAETCSGSSATCPADSFLPASTVCRPSAGGCDVAETCTGASATCPADLLLPLGTVCRASTDLCDAAESCTGMSAACPTDAVQPIGTVCRPAAGPCDLVETCNGFLKTCPADTLASAGAACGSNADGSHLCQTVTSCSGSSAACQGGAVRPSTYTCRAKPPGGTLAAGCDVAEKCDGASADCPPDAFLPAGTLCGVAFGPCAFSTTCTGTSPGCAFIRPAGYVCGSAGGACGSVPTCDGTNYTCPTSALLPAGTTCRASAGACDVAETCDGAAWTCPADQFLPAGTACRPATGECDVAETCTGSAAACPADLHVADGTSCGPSLPNESGACSGGGCVLSCAPGWADCNGVAADGCEASVSSDVLRCGGCSTVCPTDRGTPICWLGRCASDAHLATAVGASSVYNPGGTTTVPAGATVQFTVRVPGATTGQPAEVWYFLDRNLVFQGATAAGQSGTVCTAGIFPGAYPDGVQGNAQALDCLLADGSVPLVVTALASGTAAPRDDPWAAMACFAPFTTCVPVRTSLALPAGTVATTGALRTAIILASAAGAPAHPYADKAATASVFYSSSNAGSARSWFAQASYAPGSAGAAFLAGATGGEGTASDVFGPYTVSVPGCMNQGDVLAVVGGAVDYSKYERLVILGWDPTYCSNGGLTGNFTVTAAGQSKQVPIAIDYNTSFGDATLNGRPGYVLLHEFGHQLGLLHAGGWECGGLAVAGDGRCTGLVYLDATDEMGGATYAHFNPPLKEQLGWLEGGRVMTSWAGGRYRLNAYEDATENLKVLKIPRKLRKVGTTNPGGLASGWYYLAARRPASPFADWLSLSPSFASGVALYMDEGGAGGASVLVDLTPGSVTGPTDFRDGALVVGQTFSDPLSGVSVTVVSSDASGAVVDVTVPQRATRYVAAANSDGYGNQVAGAAVGGTGLGAAGRSVTITQLPPPGYATGFWMDAAWHTQSGAQPWTFTLDDDTLVYALMVAAPPANDAFANAAAAAIPSQSTAYTKAATVQAGEPSGYLCGGYLVTASCTAWYAITPATSGLVKVDSTGSDYLVILTVYTGSSLGTLTMVPSACSVATVATQKASVTFSATAGTTYYVQVGATTIGQNLVFNVATGP